MILPLSLILALLFFACSAIAEEITLKTILPRQDELRVARGVVGNGGNITDYMTQALTDGNLYVGEKVGIGTSAPGAYNNLDIQNDNWVFANVQSTNASTGAGYSITRPGDQRPALVKFLTNGATNSWQMGLLYNSGSSNNSFSIGYGAEPNVSGLALSNSKLTISSGGSVGVGVTNPQVELHVKSNDGVDGNADIGVESDAGYKWTMSSTHAGNWVLNRNIPGNYQAINVLQNGNVGLGNCGSPVSTLDVRGTVCINGASSTWTGLNVRGSIRLTEPNNNRIGNIYSTTSNYGPAANRGHKLVLTANDGSGTNNDEIWIGANTGSNNTGNIQLNASNLTFKGAAIHTTSDGTLKKDITPVPDALNRVCQLRGVNYRWKNEIMDENKLHIGVIAQEVEKVFPETVATIEGEKYVSYDELVGALIEAVKDLKKENDGLKQKVSDLELIVKKNAD